MTIRDRIAWAWPFLAALAVGAVLVTMTVALLNLAEQRRDTSEARAKLFAIARELRECSIPSPKPQPPPGVQDVRDPDEIHECIERRSATTGAAVAAAQCTTILVAQPRPAKVPEKCVSTLEYLVAEGVLSPAEAGAISRG